MIDAGYVKIHRKILKTSFYKIPLTCRLAEHLILICNHADKQVLLKTGEFMTICRGQCLTSEFALSKETGLTRQNVRTSLAHLEKADFLTKTSTKHFSVISLLTYDTYQKKEIEANQQSNQHLTKPQPTPNQQLNHKQEYKNEKNDKNKHPAPPQIEMLRQITNLYPPRDTWDALTELVGFQTKETLQVKYKAWRSHNWRKDNYAGWIEYDPTNGNGYQKNRGQSVQPVLTTCPACLNGIYEDPKTKMIVPCPRCKK